MSLVELFAFVLVVGLATFSEGARLLPPLQGVLVDERGLLDLDELLYLYAASQAVPGQNNMYVAGVGYQLYGLAGALACTLAVQLPGYLILPLLRGYAWLETCPTVRGFTRGLVAASVGLLAATTLGLARRSLTEPVAVAALGLGLVTVYLLRRPPSLGFVVAAGAGLALRLLLPGR